jgi:hypothetical protein
MSPLKESKGDKVIMILVICKIGNLSFLWGVDGHSGRMTQHKPVLTFDGCNPLHGIIDDPLIPHPLFWF